MVGEVFAGISAFSEMLGIAKSLRDMDDAVKRNAAVYDLWEKITATQAQYTAAIEQVSELKEKLRRFETWETEKQRYELQDVDRGFFAYVLKPGMEADEPPHALCATCYQRGFKSFFQSSGHVTIHEHYWFCPSCNTKVKSQWRSMAEMLQKMRVRKAAQ